VSQIRRLSKLLGTHSGSFVCLMIWCRRSRRRLGVSVARWLIRRRRSLCSAVCATRCDDWRCLQSRPPRSSESTHPAESKGDPAWRHNTADTSLRAKARSPPRSRACLTSDKRTTGSHLLSVRSKREWTDTPNCEPRKEGTSRRDPRRREVSVKSRITNLELQNADLEKASLDAEIGKYDGSAPR
jgi:hypothetical protein